MGAGKGLAAPTELVLSLDRRQRIRWQGAGRSEISGNFHTGRGSSFFQGEWAALRNQEGDLVGGIGVIPPRVDAVVPPPDRAKSDFSLSWEWIVALGCVILGIFLLVYWTSHQRLSGRIHAKFLRETQKALASQCKTLAQELGDPTPSGPLLERSLEKALSRLVASRPSPPPPPRGEKPPAPEAAPPVPEPPPPAPETPVSLYEQDKEKGALLNSLRDESLPGAGGGGNP